jgi:hypothetical protein
VEGARAVTLFRRRRLGTDDELEVILRQWESP